MNSSSFKLSDAIDNNTLDLPILVMWSSGMGFQIEIAKILPVRPYSSIIDPLPGKLNALTFQHGGEKSEPSFFFG